MENVGTCCSLNVATTMLKISAKLGVLRFMITVILLFELVHNYELFSHCSSVSYIGASDMIRKT